MVSGVAAGSLSRWMARRLVGPLFIVMAVIAGRIEEYKKDGTDFAAVKASIDGQSERHQNCRKEALGLFYVFDNNSLPGQRI